MRVCPFDGCAAQIGGSQFLCTKHWRLLAKSQQEELYRATEKYRERKISLDELRLVERAILKEVQGSRPVRR